MPLAKLYGSVVNLSRTFWQLAHIPPIARVRIPASPVSSDIQAKDRPGAAVNSLVQSFKLTDDWIIKYPEEELCSTHWRGCNYVIERGLLEDHIFVLRLRSFMKGLYYSIC